MSFDLTTLVPADEAMAMEVRHPVTGEVLIDPETKKPVVFRLLSRDSEPFQRAMHHQQNRRMNEAQRNRRSKITSEQIEAEALDLIAACTVGWSTFSYGGMDPYPFTSANARRLYGEVKAIREQVEAFIADRANFFRDSKTS